MGYAGPMIASFAGRGLNDPTEVGTGSNAGPHFALGGMIMPQSSDLAHIVQKNGAG